MLQLVVSQGRASDIPAIAERLAGRAADSAGKQIAEVRSAIELDEATIDRLAAALAKATGREVEVRAVVDPSVVGGIVARIGDTVIDGSVKRRLESLRTAVRAG
jgi:F-type H+-transporting ATPase subunit delta